MRGFYILNKANKLRVESVNQEIEKIKFWNRIDELTIFDAIMASNFSEEEIYSYAYQPTFLTPGEIGCALSHLAIYRLMVEEKIPYALIMEDDAGLVTENMSRDVFECIDEFVESKENEPFVLVLQRSIYHDKLEKSFEHFNIHKARNLFRTCGYIINLKAASAILEIQTPIRFEIDAFKFYYWLGACDLYCMNKDLIEVKPEVETVLAINDLGERKYTSSRHKRKNKNFKVLYDQLSWKKKLEVQGKRLNKFLCRHKETLDY